MHRWDRHCQRGAQARLPVQEPQNSFVVLDKGVIMSKNLSPKTAAHIGVMDADTKHAVAPVVLLPEPSMPRWFAKTREKRGVTQQYTCVLLRYTFNNLSVFVCPDP